MTCCERIPTKKAENVKKKTSTVVAGRYVLELATRE